MSSPSQLDKEDEDYEPLDEDDDEEYKPGKKKRSKRKKKQPARSTQKSASQFQVVAEIPIEFDIEPSSNDVDPSNKPEATSKKSEESLNKSYETSNKSDGLSNKSEDVTNKLEGSPNKSDDVSNNPEDLSIKREVASGSTGSEVQEPPKKKPRKMITPQRCRTDVNRKSFSGPLPAVNQPTNNGTTDKDSSALTDSANNIPKITLNSAVNRYPCGYCDTVFTDISFLERHHKRCKAKRTAESISLAQQGPINVTKPIVSQSYMQPPTGRFMYTCDKCPFSTKIAEHLKYHRPIHNDEQYFSCDQCKFSCRDVQQLKQHKKLHPGLGGESKPVKMEVKQESSDVSVSKIIKDEKPITSPSVQVSSSDKQEETNVTYTCDQCTYVTSRQSYLMMHKKIHVRDQPYQCKDCGYKCSRLAYFKKHRATHGVTDDTLISCDRCSFITSSQVVLDAHKQCHKV